MIKRIELINFMSHEHTVIEPAAGLTVLIGPNNCGKSAIVSALQVLCHNLSSKHVLRHGAKECQVIVETDDGHRIEWSRKKSGSPKYVIDGKDYDRLKGGVPDDLYRALRLPRIETGTSSDSLDVHFGEQSNPVFLLNDRGKNAAQFFASSSDASRLFEMQNLHKKRITDSKKEHKRLSTQQIQIEAAIESLKPIGKLEKSIKSCESRYQKIREDAAAIEELRIVIRALDEGESKTEQLTTFNQLLGQAPDPPSFAETKTLDSLTNQLQIADRDARRVTAEDKVFATLTDLPSFAETKTLSSLAIQLQTADRDVRRVTAEEKVFATLADPPVLASTQPIVDSVTLLRLTSTAVQELTRSQTALDKLTEPPVVDTNIPQLDSLLKSFDATQKDIQQINELKEKVESNLKRTRDMISQWADANPACPTCGSEVNTENLLTGGHSHG